MIGKRTLTLAALTLSLAGCQPAPPSYVENANALIAKQISAISLQTAQCKFAQDGHYWISACSLGTAHTAPVFALLEQEGVMQANDNLAIAVVPLNEQARLLSQDPRFTIPVMQRRIPVDADKAFNRLFAQSSP
ncbi:hypothetical protein [Serratia marcescens]|uniref:hypothetical protein n=1 Tax=Serratia marcescens TaxID=615 RepID=UPI000667AF6F|nr:hypothetical protein [Serratia marcescens]MBH2972157.1 hypothetical protein [Serratia marcescens]MBH2978229.1 hypothetical protein [Serratia marcescens]MBN3985307.1 hypothetical protein [Serratia marcescens]MBN5326296.1 hypothetical protein [Serratia marcescens]MBN5350197.1 hypothetical protein [Serratia marcescens]